MGRFVLATVVVVLVLSGPAGGASVIDARLSSRARDQGGQHPRRDRLPQEIHRAVGFENVGGQIDAVTGKRVTFAAFPWRWTHGDGCIVRLVAMLDPSSEFRIESGE